MSGSSTPAAREVAMGLLARREHSREELRRKLLQRGFDEQEVRQAVDRLTEQGLQCDERFAEGFIRSRIARAQGPVKIQAELTQRGVDRAVSSQMLREASPDWQALAREWHDRRHQGMPVDQKDRSRRMQALGRRGFSSEHFRWLFED